MLGDTGIQASGQSVAMILKIKARPVSLLNLDLAFDQLNNTNDKEAWKQHCGLVMFHLGKANRHELL